MSDDLTPEERRVVAMSLRHVALLLNTTVDADTLTGIAAKIEIGDVTATLHDVHARIEREVRDMLVDQTETLVKMAGNLSDSLGHAIALLAAINDRHDVDLPPMGSVIDAGRASVQAWQEAQPHIRHGLDALDDR